MMSVRLSHLCILMLIVSPIGCASSSAEDPRLAQSRSLAKSFGAELKSELKAGLQQGGPVHAVDVCKDIAPRIASEISRQSGAKVARTSLRFRNPGNAPEPWQSRVLRGFDQQAVTAADGEALEYAAAADDGTFRYMLAIRTDGVCLACHGEALAPALHERINDEYPLDRAVGFRLGDVRGAFSVTWPPAEPDTGS